MRTTLCCLFLLFFCSPQDILAEVDPSETTPIAPFRITDSLYYVGSEDLASYLVVTPKGNILINANLASSPPQIRASVEKLGFTGVTPKFCSTAKPTPTMWVEQRRWFGRPMQRTW